DGIRVFHVTGVQTCALPISCRANPGTERPERPGRPGRPVRRLAAFLAWNSPDACLALRPKAVSVPFPVGRSYRNGLRLPSAGDEIGRASCRESVCMAVVTDS